MIQDRANNGRRAHERAQPLARYLAAIALASGLVSAAGVALLPFAATPAAIVRYGLPLAFGVFAISSATMIVLLWRAYGSQAAPGQTD